jgi:small subunit ribosomal protein S20
MARTVKVATTSWRSDKLANLKSAIKRLRSAERRRLRNRTYISGTRTVIKRARQLIDSGDVEQAREAVSSAVRALDKAAEKGIIHKNNAARRKSRLMQQFNQMQNAA